jgi:ankyrin repeat protein
MVKKSDKPIPNYMLAIEVCRDGDLESLKLLIEDKGVNINTKDKDPESKERLIDIAVRKEHVEIIEYLIDQGVDINDKGEFRHSLLDYACSENLLSSAEVLCANGAKIEARTDIKNPTIFLAVKSGDTHLINVIIGEGGEVTQRNKYNETVFHLIFKPNRNIRTAEQRLKIFKTLIKPITKDHHEVLNIRDKYGLTPLHVACKYQLDSTNISELIRCGANVALQDNEGRTALHYLSNIEVRNVFKIAELLASIPLKNRAKDPTTSVLGTINMIAEQLLKVDKVIQADNKGRTPLSYACEVGNEQLVTLLLKNNAEVNISDKEGKSPLYYACKSSNLGLVQEIIKNSAIQSFGNKQAFIDSFTSCIKRLKDFDNEEVVSLLKKFAEVFEIEVSCQVSPKHNAISKRRMVTSKADESKEAKPSTQPNKQNKKNVEQKIDPKDNPKAWPNIIESNVDQDREDIRATLRKARAEMKAEKLKEKESHQSKFDSKKEAALKKRQAQEEKRIRKELKEKLKANLNSSNIENVVAEKKYCSFDEVQEKIRPLLMNLEEKAKPYEGYFTFVISFTKNHDLSKTFADTWQEIVDKVKSLSPEDFEKLPESTKKLLQRTPTPATYFNIAKIGISVNLSDKKLDEIEGDSEELLMIEELLGDEFEDLSNEKEQGSLLAPWKRWETKSTWEEMVTEPKSKMTSHASESEAQQNGKAQDNIFELWKIWESKLLWTEGIKKVESKLNPNAKEFVPGEYMGI